MPSLSDIVRVYFRAYESQDRNALEALLSDDFTFSSPRDDSISKVEYFERCWPFSALEPKFEVIRASEAWHDVFVTYECSREGAASFRNTECFHFRANKVQHVDVYFGSAESGAAQQAELHAIMNEMAEACRAKDVPALIKHYSPDVIAFDVVEPLQYTGAEMVGERAVNWFSSFEGPLAYENENLTCAVSGDVGFCYSLNHVHGTKKDGEPLDMWWRATVCFQKIKGRWLVTHVHNSSPFDMSTGKASIDLKP